MQEEFEIEVYTLTDEDGKESDFELVGSLDIDGQTYVALIPHSTEPEDGNTDDEAEEGEFIILKTIVEDGEEVFISIDDDEEFDKVADAFEDEIFADIDYDEDEDGDSEE